MKTENERLKEIFAKNLGQRTDTPDFELMWQTAAEGNKKKRLLVWRIAASVALIITVGTIVIFNRQDSKKDSSIQISSWREPTRILIPSQADPQLTALSYWTSPTSFLLPKNDQPIK
jgi:hypothetical protein